MSIREQLDALHEAATKGPLHHQPYGGQNQNGDYSGGVIYDGHGEYLVHDISDQDGALITALVNAWPEISRQLAALEAVRELHKPMHPTGNLVTADSPNYCGGDHGGNPPLHIDCKTVRALTPPEES